MRREIVQQGTEFFVRTIDTSAHPQDDAAIVQPALDGPYDRETAMALAAPAAPVEVNDEDTGDKSVGQPLSIEDEFAGYDDDGLRAVLAEQHNLVAHVDLDRAGLLAAIADTRYAALAPPATDGDVPHGEPFVLLVFPLGERGDDGEYHEFGWVVQDDKGVAFDGRPGWQRGTEPLAERGPDGTGGAHLEARSNYPDLADTESIYDLDNADDVEALNSLYESVGIPPIEGHPDARPTTE